MKPLAALLALTFLTTTPLPAQDAKPAPAAEDPAHQELRALRDGLLDAMNKSDLEKMLTYLHPNVVITYQNAEVARGREGAKAYQLKMTTGPAKVVESFHAAANVDELTILHGGDTGISFGSSVENFKMAHGGDITLHGRWTATLVKENGQWLVAALHCSTNLFDNPVVAATKKAGVAAGAGSIIIGLVVGWFLGKRRAI